jgi:hypothetical protein
MKKSWALVLVIGLAFVTGFGLFQNSKVRVSVAEYLDIETTHELLPKEIGVYGPPLIEHRRVEFFGDGCWYGIWRLSRATVERIRQGKLEYLETVNFRSMGRLNPREKWSRSEGRVEIGNAPICGLGGNVDDFGGYSEGYNWIWDRQKAQEALYSLRARSGGSVFNVFPDSGYIMREN